MARARSLTEFQSAFPDEASCAAFLFERRWPDGFVCPACGGARATALKEPRIHLRMLRLRLPDFLSQGIRFPLQSPLLPAHVIRNRARPHGASPAVELLGYRRPAQSPKGRGDAQARAAPQKDSGRNASRRRRRCQTEGQNHDPTMRPPLDVDEPGTTQ